MNLFLFSLLAHGVCIQICSNSFYSAPGCWCQTSTGVKCINNYAGTFTLSADLIRATGTASCVGNKTGYFLIGSDAGFRSMCSAVYGFCDISQGAGMQPCCPVDFCSPCVPFSNPCATNAPTPNPPTQSPTPVSET